MYMYIYIYIYTCVCVRMLLTSKLHCFWDATHARFDKVIIACILLNLVRLFAYISNCVYVRLFRT